MPMPEATKKKYSRRMEELIALGQKLLAEKKIIPGKYPDQPGFVGGGRFDQRSPDTVTIDESAGEWLHKVKTVLSAIVPLGHPNRMSIDAGFGVRPNESGVSSVLSLLIATNDDFNSGFLDDLGVQIEAGIAAEYLSQAEEALKRDTGSNLGHLLTAFVAGMVLERFLRQLWQAECDEEPGGKKLTLSPLIIELQRAGVVTPTKAKMLQAWAGIRNDAAHGNIEEVDPEDVKQMVKGVTNFIEQNS